MDKRCRNCNHWNQISKYYGDCPHLGFPTKHGEGCEDKFTPRDGGPVKIEIGLPAWSVSRMPLAD